MTTFWPAAGFVDPETRCLTELESGNAEKEVQPRVLARRMVVNAAAQTMHGTDEIPGLSGSDLDGFQF